MRSFAMLTLQPWTRRVEAAFQATVLAPQFRLQFDVASLTKADSETLYDALLRGRGRVTVQLVKYAQMPPQTARIGLGRMIPV